MTKSASAKIIVENQLFMGKINDQWWSRLGVYVGIYMYGKDGVCNPSKLSELLGRVRILQ